MGRDALHGGVLRVVADHRTPEGQRVSAYMRALVEPFIPKLLPWMQPAPDEAAPPTRPPNDIREQARTAGRLLLEEQEVVAALAALRLRPKKAREVRRLERRLLAVRGLRHQIEKALTERARRHRW